MPAAAKQKTEAGLLAYAKYWVDALSYAYEANDSRLVRSVSDNKCEDCKSLYAQIDKNVTPGGWSSGGRLVTETQLRDGFIPDVNGNYVVMVNIDQLPYTTFDRKGVITSKSDGAHDVFFLLAVMYRGSDWTLIDYDPVGK